MFSFLRCAWERKGATLGVAADLFAGRDAERPGVPSHAERGNEKREIVTEAVRGLSHREEWPLT
jgi:hypothetical protein